MTRHGPNVNNVGRGRIRVRHPEQRVEERESEGGQPQRRDRPRQVAGRHPPNGHGRHDGHHRQHDRWRPGRRRGQADEPHERDAELEHRARAPEDAVELGGGEVAGGDHGSDPAVGDGHDPGGDIGDEPAVVRGRHDGGPSVHVLVEDPQQRLVAESVLAERRFVEDEQPGRADERAGQAQAPGLAAAQSVRAALSEAARAASRAASISAGAAARSVVRSGRA